jgi:sulfatase maturation enzyme AslB (radical SAM superfamily)
MNAASPGVIALFQPNEFYPTQDAYLEALAEAMRPEYEAIVSAGLYLQLDSPDLGLGRHMMYKDRSDAEYLKLIGGEPLMEQDKFIKLLKRCDRSKLKILLTTNSTIIPNEELVTLLKECETVWVNLSIDTYGPLNDFLRKGSKWENVVKVLDWFANTFPGKTKVHSIISIYNINNFYLLEEFINKTILKK